MLQFTTIGRPLDLNGGRQTKNPPSLHIKKEIQSIPQFFLVIKDTVNST